MQRLLDLLRDSLIAMRTETDIALENYRAMNAMPDDVVAVVERRGTAGHVEISQFTTPEGRPQP